MPRPRVDPFGTSVHLNTRIRQSTHTRLVELARTLRLEHAGQPSTGGAARKALEYFLAGRTLADLLGDA